MKYFAVIDTNVIVSALLNRESAPGIILEEALRGRIVPILHDDFLSEYSEVLQRPKFKFDRQDVEVVLTGLIKRGIFFDKKSCCANSIQIFDLGGDSNIPYSPRY